MYDDGSSAGYWVLGTLLVILIIILVTLGVLGYFSPKSSPSAPGTTPGQNANLALCHPPTLFKLYKLNNTSFQLSMTELEGSCASTSGWTSGGWVWGYTMEYTFTDPNQKPVTQTGSIQLNIPIQANQSMVIIQPPSSALFPNKWTELHGTIYLSAKNMDTQQTLKTNTIPFNFTG